MTLEEVRTIETIVRQQWYSELDPEQARFGEWLGVNQDQFLELVELIPGRLPAHPKPFEIRPAAQAPPAEGAL